MPTFLKREEGEDAAPKEVQSIHDRIPPENLGLIGTVGGNRLDRQQMAAIIDDSATELVVAGAGTGKTTTLVGKVKYLVNVKNIPLEKILVISYTVNTVEDLKEMMQAEFGSGSKADIRTIHSIGKKMIPGKKQYVEADRERLINGMLMDLSLNDPRYAGKLIEYVESLIKFPYTDYSLGFDHIFEDHLREAANILTRCGVRYTYIKYNAFRRIKAHIVADPGGSGIRLDDTMPPVKDCVKDPSAFRDFIASLGIPSDDVNDRDLVKMLFSRWGTNIASAIGQVISRCKSTQVGIDMLIERNNHLNRRDPAKRDSIAGRLDLISKIYERYTEEYFANDLVDFDDMIIQSAVELESGHVPSFRYEYVLVDEYQDISPSLVRLLLAMRRCMGFKLFCVGDDWQSIYSFRGGDIKQMYDFDRIWGEWGLPSHHMIETTYRCPKRIVDVTNAFVMKNKKQIKKKVISQKETADFPIELLPTRKDKDISVMIGNRVDTLPDGASVFIIGRTRSDLAAFYYSDRFRVPREDASGTVKLAFMKKISGTEEDFRNTYIRFITAHSAKGLEADYVFLLADRDSKCFPSTVEEDISSLFPDLDEDIAAPEERRVFYVAMTRAKEKLFIINRYGGKDAFVSKSPFVEEIVNDNLSLFESSTPVCSVCGGPMVTRYTGELACSKYPKCSGVRSTHVRKQKVQPEPRPRKAPVYSVPYGPAPPCPICGGPSVIIRMWGRRYYGCAAYPECKGKLIQIYDD
ncbi:MAG: UvrD-helicase domain-containing protein [Candidatus Methanoplasma sp.]|jgi:superfamily I DNA/RNA helicase|nr:UvrD-helicase domain-containing protein [Candidatus Methanoplasma sp.]